MTVARQTQESVEVLSNVVPLARATQVAVESLSTINAVMRVTAVSADVIDANAYFMIVSQVAVDVLSSNSSTITLPTGIASEEEFGTPSFSSHIIPVGIASEEAFGTPVLSLTISPLGIDSAEEFGTPTVSVESLTVSPMKALYEVLLPPGAIWRQREGGDFDNLLNGMGYNLQETYDYADDLAHVRDPRATTLLSDLEKEYGISTNTAITESARRIALAALKYAVPNTASWRHLQDRLRAAGFTGIVVTPNDPAIDPALITGDVLVNGAAYSSQSPAYLMECEGDFAYAGNGKAVCGYFINIRRNEIEYQIPIASRYWRFFFFVGGAASGWPSSPAIARYTIPAGRLEEIKRLILRYKPLRSWCIMNAGY